MKTPNKRSEQTTRLRSFITDWQDEKRDERHIETKCLGRGN